MELVVASAVAVWIYMTGMFFVALKAEDNSVVDIGWGPGFILIAALCTLNSGQFSFRQILVLALVVAWGARLAAHIYARNQLRSGEDFRYRKWRESWGKWFYLRSYGQVFMLQGLLMLVIAAPIILVNAAPGGPLSLLDILGVLVWGIGFAFEAIGDQQLLVFKRNKANEGEILTSGIWAYTRHPNYFGEVVQWWGFFIIALSSPYGWVAIISPLTVTVLLLKVSGIPMLEEKYEGRPDFEAYKQRTSAFFPWFPKQQSANEQDEDRTHQAPEEDL